MPRDVGIYPKDILTALEKIERLLSEGPPSGE